MMPNLNPQQMKKMMSKMGMSMDEIDAEEVLIKLRDGGEIKISEPEVVKMKMQGKESFQVTGNVSEGTEVKMEIGEEDVDMVIEQTGASKDSARDALEKSEGDIAKAILELEEQERTPEGE